MSSAVDMMPPVQRPLIFLPSLSVAILEIRTTQGNFNKTFLPSGKSPPGTAALTIREVPTMIYLCSTQHKKVLQQYVNSNTSYCVLVSN